MSTKGGEFLFKAKYPLPKISRDGRKLTSLEALRAKVFPNFTITRLSQIFMSFGTTLYKPSTREIKLLQSVSGLRGSTENVLIPIADLDDNYSELRKEYHKDWSDKSLDAGAGETKDNAGKDQTKLSGDMPTTHRATKVPQEEQGVENHDPGSDKRSDGARNAVKPRKGRCSLSQLRIDALNDLSLDSVSTSQSVGAKTDSIVAQRVTVSGVAGQKRQAKEPVKCTTGEQRTVLKQGHEEKTQNCVKTAPISEASTRAKANKNDGTKEDIVRGKTLLSGKISQGESQQPTKTTQSTNVARRHHTAGTSGGTVTGESTTQHDPPVRHKSGEQLLSHNTQPRLRHKSGKFHPRHIGSISISTGKKIDMVQRSRLYVRARNITSAVPGLTKDTLSKLCPLFGLEWIIEKNPEESEMMKCFGQISSNKPRCPLFVRADSKWRLFALLAYLDKHFCMVESKGRPTTKKAVEIAKAELAKTPQSIGETTINGHSVTRVVLDGNVYFSGREVLSAVSNIVHHGEAFLSKCKRMGIKHVLGPPAVLKALGNGRECAKHLTSYDCRVFKTVDEESMTKLVQQLVEKPSTIGLSGAPFPTPENLNSRSGTNEGMHPTTNNVRQPSGPPSASYNENNKAKSLLQDAAPAQSNNDARAFCREEVAPEVTRTSRHAGTFWLGNPTKKELNKSDRALKYKYGIGKFSSTLQCIVENERKYCYLNDVHYVAPHRSKEDIVSVCHALGLQASLEKVEVPSIATLLQILKILMELPDDQSTTAREQNIAEKEDQLHECQPVGAQVLQSKVSSDRNMSEVDQRQHSKGGIFSVPKTHSKVPWLFHLQLDMVTVDDVENAIPAASLDNVQQYMMPPWGPEVLNMYAATAGLSQVYNSKQKLVSLRSLVPKPRDTGVVQDGDQTDKLNKSAQLSNGIGGTSSPTRHSEAFPLHASQTVEQSGENIVRPGEGGSGSILRALLSDHSYSVQKSDQETGPPTTAQNNIEVCRHTPAHITREVNGLDEGEHADTEDVSLSGEGNEILDNPTAPIGGNQGENMQCHVAESNDTTGVPASPSVNGTAAQEEARDTNPGDCGSYVTGIEADQETGSPTTAQNIVTTAQITHEVNGVDEEGHADTEGVSLSSEGKEMLDNPTAPVGGNQGECMQPTDNNRKWPSDHGDIAEASTAKRQCTANTGESTKSTSNGLGVCLSNEPSSARPSQDNVGPKQRESGVHTKDRDVAECNANTGSPASPTANNRAAQEEVRDTSPGDCASYVTGIETETTTYFEGLPVETKFNVNTINTNGDQETGSPSTAQNNIEVCRHTPAHITHEVNVLDEGDDHADTEHVSLSGEGEEMLDNPTAPVDGNQGECMPPTDNKRKLPSDHGDIAEASPAKRQCTANESETSKRTSNGLGVCLSNEPTSVRQSQDNVGPKQKESGVHTKDGDVAESNANTGVPASPTVNDTAAQQEVRDTNHDDCGSYVTGIETETTSYFDGLPTETKVDVNTVNTVNTNQETGSPTTAQNIVTTAQITHEVNGVDEEGHADTEGVSLSSEGKEMLDNPTAPVGGNQGECMPPTDNKRKWPSDHGDIAEASTAKRQCTANTGESTRRTSNGLGVCLTDEPTSARPSQDNVKQESGLHTKDCYIVESNATNGDVTWNDYIRIYRAWSEAVDGPAFPPQPLVTEKEQLKYELKWETLTESAVPIPVVEKDGSRYVLTSDVSSLVRGVDAGDFMDALGMLELSIVPCSPEISECFTSQAGKPREQCRNMVKLHMTLGATVKMLLIIVKDKRQQTTVSSNCGQHPDKSQSFAGKSISAGCTSVSHPIQRPPPARCLPATLWNRKTTSHCPSTVENSQPVATPESTSPVEALHRSSHMPQGSRSAENLESGGIRGFQTRQQSTQKLYNPVLPNMPEPRQSQSRSLTLSPELNAHFAPPLPRGESLSAANPFDQQHRSFYATQKRAISNFQGMTEVSSPPTYQQRLVQSRSPTERAQVPSGPHNYPATVSNRTYVPSQAHAQPGCSLHVSHSVPGQAFMPLVPMQSRANPTSHQYHSQPVPRHHLQISYSLSPNGPAIQPASPSHTTSWDRRPTPASTALRQYGAQHHDVPSAACSRNTDNPAPRRLP